MTLNPKGTPAPEADQGLLSPEETDQPKYMTSDEFNRAFSGRWKGLEKSISKLIEDRFPQSQPPQQMQSGEPLNTNPTNANPPIAPVRVEDSPQFRDLRAQLDEVRKGVATAQAERDAERLRSQNMAKRTMVQERLQAAGITGPQLKFATTEVLAATRYDDDSQAFVYGEGHESLPFESGVKTWLKSDDAKALLPARGVAGSGAATGGTQPNRSAQGVPLPDPITQFLTQAGLIPSSE